MVPVHPPQSTTFFRCRCRRLGIHPLLLGALAIALLFPVSTSAASALTRSEARFATEVTAEATAGDPRCPAQDAQGEGPCDLFLGYRWNGLTCESISGCDCVGADCGQLFNTLEECQRKFCRCACEPLDAVAEGECKAILGWTWDGARCHELVGCSCVGDDCDKLFASEGDCLTNHEACPCVRQDVTPVGLCEVILGWYWDGGKCDALTGCSCSGPDCDELFASPGECQKAHLKCLCRAQDARGVGPCLAILGYRWNGESCEGISGCECEGFDCDLLSPTITECRALHRACPCRAQEAVGQGPCRVVLGWKFDGAQCVAISGCDCVGTDCDSLFATQSDCDRAHRSCLCRPQDARGQGPCDQFFGYRWDGVECVAVNGCSCLGGDCDELFPTLGECNDAHKACPCRAQDATGVGGCALFHGWKWDGMSCVGVSGCTCSGTDCGNLFQDLDACKNAHTDCDPCCGCNTCEPVPQLGAVTPASF
jgi:hypothetical protein